MGLPRCCKEFNRISWAFDRSVLGLAYHVATKSLVVSWAFGRSVLGLMGLPRYHKEVNRISWVNGGACWDIYLEAGVNGMCWT